IILTSATPIEEIPDFLPSKGVKVYDFSEKSDSPRERIEIFAVKSPERDKIATLVKLLHSLPNEKVIVFVNHRESAERVYEVLGREGLPVGLYHGGLDQQKREMAVDMLNNGSTPILVSTDLGSRGLDIDKVGAVIHYHLPLSVESWIHRNGRTARINESGHVYVIISENEKCPEYVELDNFYEPIGSSEFPIKSETATLYINAGRKEKISRGDIAGYAIQALGIPKDKVGKIALKDHYALVGIPKDMVKSIISMSPCPKIKKLRVKLSIVAG
ncbi:MAG: DbpA RNA binding domain-containing protein, partial [Muribaculaceae bacterium]|nr:DbpA RNA binding domain-containing protein [Muribaculaceae bacterium]